MFWNKSIVNNLNRSTYSFVYQGDRAKESDIDKHQFFGRSGKFGFSYSKSCHFDWDPFYYHDIKLYFSEAATGGVL